jgi:hypothetical protein
MSAANWVIHDGTFIVNTLRGDAQAPVPAGGQFVCREDELPIGVTHREAGAVTLNAAEVLAAGYLDVPTGIRLAATVEQQNAYGRLITLSDVLIEQGKITGATPQTIVDLGGVEHILTTDQIKDIMGRYGMWCQSILTAERRQH